MFHAACRRDLEPPPAPVPNLKRAGRAKTPAALEERACRSHLSKESPWSSRGCSNFFLVAAISTHGSFRSLRRRRGKRGAVLTIKGDRQRTVCRLLWSKYEDAMRTKTTILELVRRCQHCQRVMDCSPREFEENPFCRLCLKDRLAKEAGPTSPVWSVPDANKMRVRVR